MHLLCVEVIAESCLLSTNKKEWNTDWNDTALYFKDELDWSEALKCSNKIPSMDTYQFPPKY